MAISFERRRQVLCRCLARLSLVWLEGRLGAVFVFVLVRFCRVLLLKPGRSTDDAGLRWTRLVLVGGCC